MMGGMPEKRSPVARFIAGVIALGGTPEAVILGGFLLGAEHWLLGLLFLSPGWFAYFALIWAAAGKRLPGEPFATWMPCILVNGFWLMALGADTDFNGQKAFAYFYVRAYVLAAVLGGIVGLIVELRRPPDSPSSQ